jgi:hypothetical protein
VQGIVAPCADLVLSRLGFDPQAILKAKKAQRRLSGT